LEGTDRVVGSENDFLNTIGEKIIKLSALRIFSGANVWLKKIFNPLQCHLRGFTLIEIVVSLAIIGISIVTIMQLFSGGLRSIKISDDYLRATILAQNKMNEFESKFSIFVNQEGVFEQDDRYHWTLSVENYDFAELHPQFENLKDENAEKSIYVDKVTLKVFWNAGHGQREMKLVTLKTSAIVNPSSKDILLGEYPSSLRYSRGEQFGEQELPSGQSEDEHSRIENISGSSKVIKNQYICGGEVKVKICGN